MLSADIEARGQEVVQVVQRWHRVEERQKPHNNDCLERIRTIIERTLTGKARKSAYKDRVAETERLKERMTAGVERGAGDVPMEPRNEERMADRHAVEAGEDEKQHEENRMRDVHIGKRGSETANEEQPDKLSKTVRFEHEAPNTSSSSSTHVSLEYPASGEQQDRPEAVLLHNFCVGCVLRDGWRGVGRYIKEVLDCYRDEDAGDLRRSELNELVERMTCLNALEG